MTMRNVGLNGGATTRIRQKTSLGLWMMALLVGTNVLIVVYLARSLDCNMTDHAAENNHPHSSSRQQEQQSAAAAQEQQSAVAVAQEQQSAVAVAVQQDEEQHLERVDELTFGHAPLPVGEEELFLLSKNKEPPTDVSPQQRWRYRSNGLYWNRTDDALYQNFHQQLLQQRLRHGNAAIVPPEVRAEQLRVSKKLHQAQRHTLAQLFDRAYLFTLEHTTFPLHDGTTYLITGDIPLMWHRDSCAQVHHYLPLLKGGSPALLALVEGLVRRQTLFILNDVYATSFRLFLDFDFQGKDKLTEWDYKSGRTVHVAMHNYELDNLAYHLRLCFHLWLNSNSLRAFQDDTWLRAIDRILDTLEYEQNHNSSAYRYPELPNQGKGSNVCPGDGLTWSGFRPSDDQTKYGYLIPANMMMVVELRRLTQLLAAVAAADTASHTHGHSQSRSATHKARMAKVNKLAQEIDDGIHKHGVVDGPDGMGRIYAYEVNACGQSLLMDDANLPSLLSLDYLEYTSPHDVNGTIGRNTRTFVLSSHNPFYFDGHDQKSPYRGIGSPHTQKGQVWHLALTVQAMTATTRNRGDDDNDDELARLMVALEETATDGVMHESFNVDNPERFTRKSFAWANSLFAELVVSRLDDIIRVGNKNKTNSTNR